MPTQSQNPYANIGTEELSESRGYTGVDYRSDVQDLTGGLLLQADNVILNMGMLNVRGGRVGKWSTELSADVYDLTDFEDGSGNAWMLSTANGKVYKTQQASGSYAEIKDQNGSSYSFNSAVTDCTVMDGYAYLADGAHPLLRLNLTSGFANYAMIAPLQSPTASLTSTLIDTPAAASFVTGPTPSFTVTTTTASFTIATGSVTISVASSASIVYDQPITVSDGTHTAHYTVTSTATGTVTATYAPLSGDSSSGTMASGASVNLGSLIGNGSFGIGSGTYTDHELVGLPWGITDGIYNLNGGSNPDYGPGSNGGSSQVQWNGNPWTLLLDNPGDSVGQIFYPVANNTTSYPNPSTLTKNACFLFQCYGRLENAGSLASLAVTVIAYNSSGPITSQSVVLAPNSNTSFNQMTACFNFTQSISTDPVHYFLQLSSGPNNTGLNGVWVAGVSIVPMSDGPTLTQTGANVQWSAPYCNIGGSYIVEDFGTGGINLSTVGIISTPITSAVPLTDIYLRFGFVEVGQTAIAWSNDLLFTADGTTAYCDLTTLTSAYPAVMANVRYRYIQAVLDLPDADVAAGTQTNIITFGAFSAAGQLSYNADAAYSYTWYVTETALIDSTDWIEGNPSGVSATLLPTATDAEGNIVLPSDCPKNAATTHYNLYRAGGAWSDNRLICTVPIGYSVAYGADAVTDYEFVANPYFSWNHTTGTWVDNTPDLFLTLANLMSFSKDPMPANLQCCCEWQGRLCAAVGNTVYISWLANSTTSAAVMTTLVLNQSDPNYPIAGANFLCSPDSTDTIVRMVSFGTPVAAGNQFGGGLLVLNKRSIYLIQGEDSSTFTCKKYDYQEGCGLIAFRGVARLSAGEIVFMGPDRLHMFPPTKDSPSKDLGLMIQPILYPAIPVQQTLQNQTAFAKSWMLYHNNCLYLGAPTPGDTANTVIWCYNFQIGGWTRWMGMNITSARSMPPSSNGAAYELYLYDTDGQLNVISGTEDIAYPGATPQPITFTVTVHGLRPQFYYRMKFHPLYYRRVRLREVFIEVVMNGTLNILAQAYDIGPTGPTPISGASTSINYTLTGGGKGFQKNIPSAVEGTVIFVTVSGSVTSQAWVRGVRGMVEQTSVGF